MSRLNKPLLNSIPLGNRLSVCLVLTLIVGLTSDSAHAQASRDRRDSPSEKQLELRIEKAQEALVQEFSDVAAELYQQGSREKSLEVLKRLERISDDLPGLKDKIREIREELMSDNPMEMDVDVSRGWGNPLAVVTKDRPFRMAASGEYKLSLTATVPMTGLPTEDPAQDYLKMAPFGALVGVIVTEGKPGEPFAVPETLQMTPKETGQLFVRVNVPAAARCTGRIQVRLSGYVQPAPRSR